MILQHPSKKYENTFFALGTVNTITAYGTDCKEALEAAQRRISEIDDRMSAFKADSDVMKINSRAGVKAERVHADTFCVLKRALEFSEAADGAFDITTRPLTALWGFGSKQNFIPDQKKITETLKLVNYKDLLLDNKRTTACLKNKGQAIDLGGIAKGYAADEVRCIFRQYQVENALINLGGNVIAMGNNPTGARWRIGIQNPLAARGQYIGTIKVTDKTVVTSGSNEQFFIKNGVRYHHIINPRTGYPADNGLLSVTVICECSMDADAVTTALFIQDIQESMHMLRSIHAEAVFIMQNKDIFVTEGLSDNFKRSPI